MQFNGSVCWKHKKSAVAIVAGQIRSAGLFLVITVHHYLLGCTKDWGWDLGGGWGGAGVGLPVRLLFLADCC